MLLQLWVVGTLTLVLGVAVGALWWERQLPFPPEGTGGEPQHQRERPHDPQLQLHRAAWRH